MSTITVKSTVTINETTVALWEYQGKKYFDWGWEAIPEAVARVNRGAALLDEKQPGWAQSVAPAKLDMASSSFCIIGQSYGEFTQYYGIPFGMRLLDADLGVWSEKEEKELDRLARDHGFLEIDDDIVPFDLLDRVWVYLLTERSSQGFKPLLLEPPARPSVNRGIQLLTVADLLGYQDKERVAL